MLITDVTVQNNTAGYFQKQSHLWMSWFAFYTEYINQIWLIWICVWMMLISDQLQFRYRGHQCLETIASVYTRTWTDRVEKLRMVSAYSVLLSRIELQNNRNAFIFLWSGLHTHRGVWCNKLRTVSIPVPVSTSSVVAPHRQKITCAVEEVAIYENIRMTCRIRFSEMKVDDVWL